MNTGNTQQQYSGTVSGAIAPRPASSLDGEVVRLQGAVAGLDTEIGALVQRLSPVIDDPQQPVPSTPQAVDERPRGELAVHIREQSRRLDSITDRLRLLHRDLVL